MYRPMLRRILIVGCLAWSLHGQAQEVLEWMTGSEGGLVLTGVRTVDSASLLLPDTLPAFSVRMNGEIYFSGDAESISTHDETRFVFPNGVTGSLATGSGGTVLQYDIEFINTSPDTVVLENVVPLGENPDHIYITASGPRGLARSKLFLPGRGPVGVILPDNAWELGYGAVSMNQNTSLALLARRIRVVNGIGRRYQAILPPRASVIYRFYNTLYRGAWQEGLREVFQHHYLFDLESFDDTLYRRNDLKWIRNQYLAVLQFAWDHEFYDPLNKKYRFFGFLEEGKKYFGGYDIYGLWPTWPRLGLDQRNQWDLYSDLPLGIPKLRELAHFARQNNTHFFISYNPWDTDTRAGNQMEAMAGLIREIDADGVVLDTRGSSSYELQKAADSVRPGVIMYSEGMAVPKDMPGIVAGRVHDAIYYAPPLNLNKLIKPEFSIFRVCQLSSGNIHREVAISFFNGYGVELNTFAPGRPDWREKEFRFLGKAVRILRENSAAFHSRDWTPLIPTTKDSIWVNQWPGEEKTIYTILNLRPGQFEGPLFKADTGSGHHFVSLWSHREIATIPDGDKRIIDLSLIGFPQAFSGTRQEGVVECVAQLPVDISAKFHFDTLLIETQRGDSLLVWKGNPSYEANPLILTGKVHKVNVREQFEDFEGKYVIQSFRDHQLVDERIMTLTTGKPYLITRVERTKKSSVNPPNMVYIPGGTFFFKVSNPDNFIPYPEHSRPQKVTVRPYYMDKFPVTNEDFYNFMLATNYRPKDPANFLKHWENGKYKPGQEDYPVVWVNLDDARAYAEWAGKRLPTEIEWQFAAQGTDGRLWPWGNDFLNTRCNNGYNRPTPVEAFPKGKSPFRVEDLVGNVWQLTNDVYDNGSYYFVIIRGGSYFNPTSSQWYIKGGPQPLDQTQMLLMVSPGFDRSATIGFRCVKDAVPKKQP